MLWACRVNSTCVQLSAALCEGLRLCTELRDLTVHRLQVCIINIFELGLQGK